MSIATEITRLQNAKSALKTAIEVKGVTVPSEATLDAYPSLVDSIPTGGGEVKYDIRDKIHTPLMISAYSGKLSFIISDGTSGKLYYSRDLGNSWTELSSEEEVDLEGIHAPIMFSGNLFNNSGNGIGRFSSSTSSRLNIYGNPESLWKGGSDGSGNLATKSRLDWQGFYKLMFSGLIIEALSIYLCYTKLSAYCYEGMFQNSDITTISSGMFPGGMALAEGSLKSMFKGCTCSDFKLLIIGIDSLGSNSMESMFEGWNSRFGGTSGYSPLISVHNLNNTIPQNGAFKRLFYGSGVTMVRFEYNYNTGGPYTPDSGAIEDWLANLTYETGHVIGFDWWDLNDLPSGWT